MPEEISDVATLDAPIEHDGGPSGREELPPDLLLLKRYIEERLPDVLIALPGVLEEDGYSCYARCSIDGEGPIVDRYGKALHELAAKLRNGGWMIAIGYPMKRLVHRPEERDGTGTLRIADPGVVGLFAKWSDEKMPLSLFRSQVRDTLLERFPNHFRDLEVDDLEPAHILLDTYPILNDAEPAPMFYKVWLCSKKLRRAYAVVLTLSANGREVQIWRSVEPVQPLAVPNDETNTGGLASDSPVR